MFGDVGSLRVIDHLARCDSFIVLADCIIAARTQQLFPFFPSATQMRLRYQSHVRNPMGSVIVREVS